MCLSWNTSRIQFVASRRGAAGCGCWRQRAGGALAATRRWCRPIREARADGGAFLLPLPEADQLGFEPLPAAQQAGGQAAARQEAAFLLCRNACAVAAWPEHRAECQRIQAAREERATPILTNI